MSDSVLIDCPAHPSAHWAALDEYPSKTAGYWECPRGDSDYCEHPERHVESVQVDYWPTPDIDSSYDVDMYVCDLCGVAIDLDEANPAEDAHDAMVDAQIDEMRGK